MCVFGAGGAPFSRFRQGGGGEWEMCLLGYAGRERERRTGARTHTHTHTPVRACMHACLHASKGDHGFCHSSSQTFTSLGLLARNNAPSLLCFCNGIAFVLQRLHGDIMCPGQLVLFASGWIEIPCPPPPSRPLLQCCCKCKSPVRISGS